MKRDFTYIDDIVEGVIRAMDKVATVNADYEPLLADPASGNVPYRLFNIGNNDPVQLLDFIGAIEKAVGKTAEKRFLPMQDGDVPATYADTSLLADWVGFAPSTPIQEGVDRFISWYRDYYKV
jgi:UDP-glucuronate 4-epimerase